MSKANLGRMNVNTTVYVVCYVELSQFALARSTVFFPHHHRHHLLTIWFNTRNKEARVSTLSMISLGKATKFNLPHHHHVAWLERADIIPHSHTTPITRPNSDGALADRSQARQSLPSILSLSLVVCVTVWCQFTIND